MMGKLITQGTIEFLVENRMRDDKQWFDEHKDVYAERVVEPFVALAQQLEPEIKKIDPFLKMPVKVGGCISRIRRDTRFTKDKTLYRDVMWISILRQKGMMLPEFYFVLTPDEYFWGCGYYAMERGSMDCMREMILAGNENFQRAQAVLEDGHGFVLDGEKYKRPHHKDAPEALQPWLDSKALCLTKHSRDWAQLYSADLWKLLAEDFLQLAPMYRFLMEGEMRARGDALAGI